KLATVAILTSVYDSDQFEFLVFHKGRQADAAVSDPESHGGGLKILSGKRRAQVWHDMFLPRDIGRAMQGGAPIINQVQDLQAWQERLKAASAGASVFAEDRLSRWCELAGLSPNTA